MIEVKICGLFRPEDIDAVNEARPDYAGFVFAPSRRQVTPSQASDLKNRLSRDIRSVGVFVNEDPGLILSLADHGVIDLIQLHGDEDESYLDALKAKTSLPVIRAVRVRAAEDIRPADRLSCDYLLLDTYIPGIRGGAGACFDWSLIPDLSHPFFLAGGLTPANFSLAARTGACCLDLSSAAETDGFKDPEKIMNIVNTIRSINQCQMENLAATAASSYPKP